MRRIRRLVFLVALLIVPVLSLSRDGRLFGSIEFPRKAPAAWESANLSLPADNTEVPGGGTWKTAFSSMRGENALSRVNAFWNLVPYKSDQDAWGLPDYWAAPREFLERGGDCEDYALAKYATLRELGFREEDMRVVVVTDLRNGLPHAVLTVRESGEWLVLDSLTPRIEKSSGIHFYRPQRSVNGKGAWQHLIPGKKK